MISNLEKLLETLRCPECQGCLQYSKEALNNVELSFVCNKCDERFPIIDGIPRLLLSPLREALLTRPGRNGRKEVDVTTAQSFGFEWIHFPEMYEEWHQSFLDYMSPHGPDYFKGKKVLDVGCGNGRFAYYAARFGAEVWAFDLGPAVGVAQRNTEGLENVQIVQADLHKPPFSLESFDFIYSIGVLHHLADPEIAFRNLLRFLRPNGKVQIYLYWKPEGKPFKAAMLSFLTIVRSITTRLPHTVVYVLSYPAALVAFLFFVWPYKLLTRIPGLRSLAERIPMKQYARFPFRVCVNDQLDRFSAPIENRYTRQEVAAWLNRAGLEDQAITANYGWLGSGRKPKAFAMAK